MTGEFSIASFNLHNFNYDVRVGGTGTDSQFKKAKCEHISEIIRDGGYDVIALQEVQTPETVASLVGELNEGNPNGRYAFVHCHDFYETISNGRFKSPGREKRGELAFIYNSESVALFKDCAVYQRLNDRMWLALDYFISGAAALLATSLGVGAIIGDDEDDDPESERDKDKRNKTIRKPNGLKTVGALGVAGVGYATHKLLESLLKRMRPPFVAFFCRKAGGKVDAGRQLRLINVHSQFGRTDVDRFTTPSQIRTKEAEFVLREAFQIVKSEQTENSSLTLTMAAGDFNRSAKCLQAIATEINAMPMRSDKMQIGVTRNANVPDAHLTTVAVSNHKEVKNGNAREYTYSHDYDHFAFDMDVWSPSDAKRAFGLDHEKFFVLEGNERRALSDHLPVVIKTAKLERKS